MSGQLDKVIAEMTRRAWTAGAGPDGTAMTIDMDSTIVEVHGKANHGAANGYTHKLGYHPLVATRADTGEVGHARLRKGSSQRGHKRFVEELITRVRRCGANGTLTLRADSGFWSWALIDTLTRLGVHWSVTVSVNPQVKAGIEAIDETAWTTITYPDGGEAQVADTIYVTGRGDQQRRVRLVVRRTRLTNTTQAQLWPDWRHHAFVTDNDLPVIEADQFHRDHARVELAIRDLKEGAGFVFADPDGSSRTPPGSPAPCSPTTSPAGPSASPTPDPSSNSPSPPPYAPASTPYPDGS